MVCLFRIKVTSACFPHLSSHSVLLLEDISVYCVVFLHLCYEIFVTAWVRPATCSRTPTRADAILLKGVIRQSITGFRNCLETSANVVYCTPRLTFCHSHAVSLLFLFSSAFPLKLTPLVVSSVFISEKGKLGCILSSGHFTALFRFSIGCFFIIPK